MIGEFAALGAAISWAIAPILYRKALNTVKPVTANIVRCATNAGVLFGVLLLLGDFGVLAALPTWVIVITVVSGIVGLGIGDTLYLYGLKQIGVSRAVPLAAAYPLFSLVWAVALLGHAFSLVALLGTLTILLGIWLLSSQKNETFSVSGKTAWLGVAACLATAVVWSVSITLMDWAVTYSGVTTLSANYAIITLRIGAMALFLLALAPFIDRDHSFLKLSRKAVVLLCVGGLVANGIGWLLMNYSFQNMAGAQAVTISSTSPLFAAVAGFTLFRERATLKTIFGALAVVAGIVLIFII
jgi:drug/metabolite transporter, DME family